MVYVLIAFDLKTIILAYLLTITSSI